MICAWIALVTGLFLVSIALMMKTKNVRSSIVFKVIPFMFGLANLFSSGVLFGFFEI